MAKRTRVLIADDQELFALGLKVVIESRSEDLTVVGICADGRAAVEFVEKQPVDIILMDVRMPLMDGVEATKAIHERWPNVKILILTTFDDDEYVRESLLHGAIGYLMKERPADEIVQAIHAIDRGIVQIDRAVSGKVLVRPSTSDGRNAEIEARLQMLTDREAQVLRRMVKALRIVEIADDLGIAEQTVRNHIRNIYSKLDIHDRYELVKYIQPIRSYLGARTDT